MTLRPVNAYATILTSATPSSVTGYYGETIQGNGLANLEIGKQVGRKVAYLVRCDHSGTLNTVSWFKKTDNGAGYSGGTGGSVKLEVQTNSGGLPSGSLVSAGASATATTSSASDAIMQYNLGTPPSLVNGTIYWLVWTQQDASPTVNWVSLDNLYLAGAPTPLQPTYADTDLAVYWDQTGGGYVINRGHYPVIDLAYADGYHGGQGYADVKSQSGQYAIGGNNKVRLNLTPSSTKLALEAHAFLFKQASTAGNLVVNLRNLTAGTLLGSQSFAPAAVTATGVLDMSTSYALSKVDWTGISQSLASGTNYALELTAPTEATNPYVTYPIQAGGSGFNSPLLAANRFTDGYFEKTSDGTTWTTHSGSTDYKMQGYFGVA